MGSAYTKFVTWISCAETHLEMVAGDLVALQLQVAALVKDVEALKTVQTTTTLTIPVLVREPVQNPLDP